jgi:hypothetical protein
MTIVSIKISERERRKLLKHGSLSETTRDGIQLYLGARRSRELLKKLEELHSKNPVRTTALEEVNLIKEGGKR